MPGNVGNENADTFFVHDQEIVEIARHGAHRNVTRSEFETSEDRNTLRKN